VAGGVAAHQLVESGFAGSIDLKPAALVVGDAALAGRHDRDSAVGVDELAERFDDPHRAQRVSDHKTGELLGRDVRDGLVRLVGGARIHEQEVKCAGAKPVAERLDLLRRGDVAVFDLQPTVSGVAQLVQLRSGGAADGRHHLGTTVDVFLADRVAQATRGADEPNNDGNADITYTASTSNVSCYVVAVEGHGGKSAEAVIYQGTTRKQSPAFIAQYPTTLPAGASKDFTIKAANPTSTPVPAIRPEFVIFPGDGATQNVNAGQVQLSYSTTGANGSFTPVPLTGSTINGGAIEGWVGPLQGLTLAPDSTTTYTLHVGLATSVPASKSKPLLAFESFMDQINPANGTGATLADTYAYQVKVPGSTASSNTLLYILITVGVVALAILGLAFWGRRQAHGGPPPAPQAT
jgi:hypothetical protein